MKIAALALAFMGVACSAPEMLEIPYPPDTPNNWKKFSTSTIAGTDCPILEGEYLEPPSIYRSGKEVRHIPKDNMDLYGGYIPFHLGERNELSVNEMNLTSHRFVIRQPNATQFYFFYLIEQTNTLVEYHFRSEEGDFECQAGHIEFPKITRYGMIEGRSMNFQIRNILLKDKSGALVIQSTRGPYRGNPSKAEKEFSYEFFRYSKANSAGFK